MIRPEQSWGAKMRSTFIRQLVDLAADDERIVLLTGDLGYTVLEPFADRFPARFFNVGVSEQNLVGLATGLAEAGFIPFVYSIVPFSVLRPYEFIRNGPVRHRLPVRIVGVGGGVDYGTNGVSHYGLEDIGVMRMLPGMTVIAPVDGTQARASLSATWQLPGPVYYRLAKNEKIAIPGIDGPFSMTKVPLVREGNDVLVLCTGGIGEEACVAADMLSAKGVQCAVGVVACISPAPVEAISGLVCRYPLVVTVEDHFDIGGLGSMVAETAASLKDAGRLVRIGVGERVLDVIGSRDHMCKVLDLSAPAISARVMDALNRLDCKWSDG